MIRNQIESLKSIASYQGTWEDLNRILAEIGETEFGAR